MAVPPSDFVAVTVTAIVAAFAVFLAVIGKSNKKSNEESPNELKSLLAKVTLLMDPLPPPIKRAASPIPTMPDCVESEVL
ncbi:MULTISPECIES: hypothetical protein [unclassified Azospirillum]|uniref:hypothetical protein n=1 Tax=unclassified Azospirillum TaxID=2630922 RepID=UPI001FFF4281|nr:MULTISPECIES: hypothetical protein [unclassified Azospirillum]